MPGEEAIDWREKPVERRLCDDRRRNAEEAARAGHREEDRTYDWMCGWGMLKSVAVTDLVDDQR